MSIENSNLCKIFVGNVPFQCTKEEFIECFKKYNGFIDADIVNRYNSDNCRGFGFITFNSVQTVESFLNEKDNIILKNRVLRFTEYSFQEKSQYSSNLPQKNYLFIKNVPLLYTPQDIKNVFEKYGEIGTCFINTNNITGESKGTAVIEMKHFNTYEILLNMKEIELQTNIKLEVTRWKQKIKVKKHKNNIIDAKDMYRIGFNAGRSLEVLNASKTSTKFL
jgi:RNA recognition motif-containing protein